jgi:oxaloacetate decarboxylase alpha subunit
MDRLTTELKGLASEHGFSLAESVVDDVLTYALFPQIGLKFLQHRGDASAFEPVPTESANKAVAAQATYTVNLDGQDYVAQVSGDGSVQVQMNGRTFSATVSAGGELNEPTTSAPAAGSGEPVVAPLAGNIFRILVGVGDVVQEGETIIILEAMKMETEVNAKRGGTISKVVVREGDAVRSGDVLLEL